MLINEEYRKSTSFLYIDTKDTASQVTRREPRGTVFFVSLEYVPNHFDYYAVTARHIITNSYEQRPLYVRISLSDGGYTDLELANDDWLQHPTTDVAIIPVDLPPNADMRVIPTSYLATDEFIAQRRVGVGDELFFIGLFSEHSGSTRPLPIIRFGHISLMPHEPVKIKPEPDTTPISVEAYLAEAISWGGQSGSPVFIHFPPDREYGFIQLPELPSKEPPYRLLGLVSGHFDISRKVEMKEDYLGDAVARHNSGIAVVIPAKYILKMLDYEELQARRNNLKQQQESETE